MTVPSFLRGEKWVQISKNDFEVQVEDSRVHYRVFLCHLLLKQSKWNVYSGVHLTKIYCTQTLPCADANTGANRMSGVYRPKLSHWCTSKLLSLHWKIKDIRITDYIYIYIYEERNFHPSWAKTCIKNIMHNCSSDTSQKLFEIFSEQRIY